MDGCRPGLENPLASRRTHKPWQERGAGGNPNPEPLLGEQEGRGGSPGCHCQPGRRKHEAAPRISKIVRDFPLKMRGRKQSALRPDQERLLVVFLSAAVASSELPEPQDERPARSGRVGISRVTRRTRGESPVLARARRPLPVPAWEHRDPSSSQGKTNRTSSPLKKKTGEKQEWGSNLLCRARLAPHSHCCRI